MHFSTIATMAFAMLLAPLNAYVVPSNLPTKRAVGSTPADQLANILKNPNACASSNSGECVPAASAVGPIIDGLNQFKILTASEQAAVVSLMAFESVDFEFNHNVSPGRPGQGTRAMLMPDNVAKFVKDSTDISDSDKQKAGTDPVAVLKLVQDDKHSFASASWYYSTQCSADIKKGVQTGGRAGWENYIKNCVQTTVTDDRAAYWQRACAQFGVPTN